MKRPTLRLTYDEFLRSLRKHGYPANEPGAGILWLLFHAVNDMMQYSCAICAWDAAESRAGPIGEALRIFDPAHAVVAEVGFLGDRVVVRPQVGEATELALSDPLCCTTIREQLGNLGVPLAPDWDQRRIAVSACIGNAILPLEEAP